MHSVITLVDITTQKLGLAMLETTEKQLSAAQQVSEAKSDFLSKVAHEIRTPINALTGLSQMATQQIEVDDKESLKASLAEMADTIKYMTSIVSDISDMTKTDTFAIDSEEGPFVLREVIERVAGIINPRVAETGLTFEVNIPDNFNPSYVGSKTRIQQILINFLNNAVKYTPRGGVISLKAFEESTIGSQAYVCFVITDNGIGISEGFIPQLFKPFAREKRDDDEETSSMGLGLSIAYNLIKMMNGDVRVESEVGKGTVFTIHLMLDKYASADVVPMETNKIAELPNYKLDGKNILLVDDNDMNRKILSALLVHEGMTFSEATGGEDAVKKYLTAPDNSFDCILMDIIMPDVDGIDATRSIRSSNKPDAKTVPIIGVSANGFPEDINKAMSAGMNGYTTKPINNRVLFNEIARLVNKK